MVKENFNKFVTARNTVNSIKENAVSTTALEQLNSIRQSIQQVLQHANDLSNPLMESKAKQIQIQKNIELIHDFEPFLNANTRIKQLFAVKNYDELANCYRSCKSLYSSIKKTRIVDNLWNSVERTVDTIRTELLREIKSGRLSNKISKVPTILMYL